jgi:phosphoglycerate dehydrogenase-like enzyme
LSSSPAGKADVATRPPGRVTALLVGPYEDAWVEALAARFPDVDVLHYPHLAQALEAGVGPRVHVLLAGGGHSVDALLEQAPHLTWIQASTAGIDGMATPLLRQRSQVVVTVARGIHTVQMAEHTLTLVLALTRSLPQFLRQKARREWKRYPLPDLRGRTALVVGYGTLGRAVGRTLQAVGVRVVGVRRREGGRDGPVPIHPVERLDDLLPQAHYVILVLPRTPATWRLFDQRRLARMRPGSFLINVGRGGTVDEEALAQALREGPLAGAALDVFEEEPLPPHSPLWDMDNLIVTPHVAAASPRYFQDVLELFAQNLARYLAGQPLLGRADPKEGY